MPSYGGYSGKKVPRPRGKHYDIRKTAPYTWTVYKNNVRWQTVQTKAEAEQKVYIDQQGSEWAPEQIETEVQE